MHEANPLHEARALLLQFQRSELKAVHVATQWLEFFASRDPAWSARARLADLAPSPAEPRDHLVTAAHLGTLVAPLPIGTPVSAGEVVARLRVLDRLSDVLADRAGTIVACHAAEGVLVEYGQPLFSLA